jgi:hypothetical protein
MNAIFPSCLTCAYMDDGNSPADEEEGKWLLCRRHAPTTFAEATDGYSGGTGVFPRVERDDWCGEWVQNCVNTNERKQMAFLACQLEVFEADNVRITSE